MTTNVTVDAHAGWPVQVIRRSRNEPPGKNSEEIIVEPNTKRDIACWDDNELLIREMRRPASPTKPRQRGATDGEGGHLCSGGNYTP